MWISKSLSPQPWHCFVMKTSCDFPFLFLSFYVIIGIRIPCRVSVRFTLGRSMSVNGTISVWGVGTDLSSPSLRLHAWHVEVLVPGMEPMPPWRPKPLQWQYQILNPLCHKGTLSYPYLVVDVSGVTVTYSEGLKSMVCGPVRSELLSWCHLRPWTLCGRSTWWCRSSDGWHCWLWGTKQGRGTKSVKQLLQA